MKLTKIFYTGFKGQSGNYRIPDKGILFEGRNGAGKTTIIDAICWCLFGKFSDRTETSPKPLDHNNQPITQEIKVELTTNQGIFARTYREKWTTPRGKANAVLTGHETGYYLDDIKVLAREFNDKVASLFSEEQFYITAIPTYFGDSYHWKERRKMLSQMIGEPTEDQLIEKEPELSEILEEGKDNQFYEDRLKMVKEHLRKCNEDRNRLPEQIKERQRDIVAVEYPEAIIRSRLKEWNATRESILAGAGSPELLQKKEDCYLQLQIARDKRREELDKLESEVELKMEEIDKEYNKETEELRRQLKEITGKQAERMVEIRKLERNRDTIDSSVEQHKWLAEKYKIELNKADNIIEELKETEITREDEYCPTCKQKLPEEEIERGYEIRKKNLEERVRITKDNRDTISTNLSETRSYIAKQEGELTQLKSLIEEKTAECLKLEEKGKEINDKLNNFRIWKDSAIKTLKEDTAVAREEIEESFRKQTEEIEKQKADLQKQIDEYKPDTTEIDEKIKKAEELLRQIEKNKEAEARIKVLDNQKKELGFLAESYMKEIYLLELRLKTWAEIIEADLNAHFQIAKFKLFDIQVNGEVKEVCEVLYKGRATMSQGEAIYVGVDIADAFAKHWDISPPLLVDGIQNLTLDLPTDRQKILTRTTTDNELMVKEVK